MDWLMHIKYIAHMLNYSYLSYEYSRNQNIMIIRKKKIVNES